MVGVFYFYDTSDNSKKLSSLEHMPYNALNATIPVLLTQKDLDKRVFWSGRVVLSDKIFSNSSFPRLFPITFGAARKRGIERKSCPRGLHDGAETFFHEGSFCVKIVEFKAIYAPMIKVSKNCLKYQNLKFLNYDFSPPSKNRDNFLITTVSQTQPTHTAHNQSRECYNCKNDIGLIWVKLWTGFYDYRPVETTHGV